MFLQSVTVPKHKLWLIHLTMQGQQSQNYRDILLFAPFGKQEYIWHVLFVASTFWIRML